jgi:hypothetical protein
MNIDTQLKSLSLHRQTPVGKNLGEHIWLHTDYAADLINQHLIDEQMRSIHTHTPDFNPNLMRVNKKSNEIMWIESADFDTSPEPMINRTAKLTGDSIKLTKGSVDPLIYHHKFMFVKDDYQGFDTLESKERSVTWRKRLGVNSGVSSRIGRKSYWLSWLMVNCPDLLHQEYSSKSTSINSTRLPKGFNYGVEKSLIKKGGINLDIGGGKYDIATEELAKHDVTNLIYDPFNRSQQHNSEILQIVSAAGGADSITILNVLNVIKEEFNRKCVLMMANESLKVGGTIIILIYEGDKKHARTGLSKSTGHDRWQNFFAKEFYLDEIKAIFPNAYIKNGLIIATK